MNRSWLAVAAVLALTACSGSSTSDAWQQEILYLADTKLGGCTVGDLHPDHEGQEVASVAANGQVLLTRRTAEHDGWVTGDIAQLRGEAIQCVAADLLPNIPGDELVTVGAVQGSEDDPGPGVAFIFSYAGSGTWKARELLELDALIHAVCVGDLSPEDPGLELLVAGYTGKAHVLSIGDEEVKTVAELPLPGHAKGAAFDGRSAWVVCADGSLVRIQSDGEQLAAEVVAEYPDALARVDAGPEGVLICANDGKLRFYRNGETRVLLEREGRLRGAVMAEIDASHPGIELATAGYDMGVHLVLPQDVEFSAFESRVNVGTDGDRFHHLTAGLLPGLGRCLVGCGYSGRLTAYYTDRR